MILEAYQDRRKRDARAKQLRAEGKNVIVRTSRGSLLHPQYVNDYEGLLDVGPCNSQYRTYWSRLYHLEAR